MLIPLFERLAAVSAVFGGLFVCQNALKQKTGQKPVREIVQADYFLDMPAGTFIVPGAESALIQKTACNVLSGKNAESINTSPCRKGETFYARKQRAQQAGAAIDGKHPQRCPSHQSHISSLQRVHGGKSNFKTPSCQAAFKKVFNQSFHHKNSMVKISWNYT